MIASCFYLFEYFLLLIFESKVLNMFRAEKNAQEQKTNFFKFASKLCYTYATEIEFM